MIKILRQVNGNENWPKKPVLPIGEWEVSAEGFESATDAAMEIIAFIDISECDGDVPSAWRLEIDGELGEIVDAQKMSPDERTSFVPEEIREGGREEFGGMIKELVADTLKKVEEDSK